MQIRFWSIEFISNSMLSCTISEQHAIDANSLGKTAKVIVGFARILQWIGILANPTTPLTSPACSKCRWGTLGVSSEPLTKIGFTGEVQPPSNFLDR